MTFAAVGSAIFATGSFSLTPSGIGDLILLEVVNEDTDVAATALASGNVTWAAMGSALVDSGDGASAQVFAGTVTGTGAATVSITWGGTAPTNVRMAGQEFSSTVGSWTLDTQGNLINLSGTNTWPSLTPAGAGELYFGFALNAGSAAAGSTSGYTYASSPQHNGMAYNAACTSSAQAPVWGDSGQLLGVMVLVKETGGTTHNGTAALTGTGTLTAGGVLAGSAALTGTGTLTAAGHKTVPGAAALSGSGTLTAAGAFGGAAALTGTGTLAAAGHKTVPGAAALTGTGTLGAGGQKTVPGAAALTGTGTLTATPLGAVAGAAALTGTGTLTAGGQKTVPGAAALTGLGALGAAAHKTIPGTVAMTGTGTLTGGGSKLVPGAVALTGTGTLTATGSGSSPSGPQQGTASIALAAASVTIRNALTGTVTIVNDL